MDAAEIPVYSRVTQGVRVMRIGDGLRLVTVTRADKEPDELGELGEADEAYEADEVYETDAEKPDVGPEELDENL